MILDYLADYLPGAFNFYQNYYSPYEAYLRPLYRYLFTAQYYVYRYVFPYLWPAYKILSRLISKAMGESPDLAAIVILALLLFISLRLLDMLRRQIMFWVSMGIRLALWSAVGLLGFYVYQRGVDQSIEDFGWVLGYLAEVGDEGDRIGQAKARRKAADARRNPGPGPRGRTRGSGW